MLKALPHSGFFLKDNFLIVKNKYPIVKRPYRENRLPKVVRPLSYFSWNNLYAFATNIFLNDWAIFKDCYKNNYYLSRII
jgi:hypothetical protein